MQCFQTFFLIFFRIIRKLVLEKYLWEELAVSQEGVVSAYVKPGPKAQRIKTDKITINIEKKIKDTIANVGNDDGGDNVLKTLEEEAFNELKNVISKNFPDLKSVYLAVPIECFREIAEKLPVTKAEMLEIDQMTHFRFDRFGVHLLQICKEFNAKRMNYLEDKQMAEMMAKEEEANVFSAPSSSNPVYQNDTQRRSGWMGKTGGSSRGASSSGFRGRGRGSFKKRGSFRGGRGKKRSFSNDSPKSNNSFTSNSFGTKKPSTTTSKFNAIGLMGPPRAKTGFNKLL